MYSFDEGEPDPDLKRFSIDHDRGYINRNGEIVGSLPRTSFWSSEFQAESQHGSWRFLHTGCFGNRTEIIVSRSDIRIAIMKPN
jgi:hypothetical protein